jgi:hypothetical protein
LVKPSSGPAGDQYLVIVLVRQVCDDLGGYGFKLFEEALIILAG